MRHEPCVDDSTGSVGLVVPLRSFSLGKARLAGALDASERPLLARRLAERVVGSAGGRAVAVVSSASEVVAWARDLGADVLDDPGSLDAAAEAGRTWSLARGHARTVIAHADLPLVTTFDPVAFPGSLDVAAVVPCHRFDGTPVISLPTAVPFGFAYGPGSFARHCREAARRGLDLRVVLEPALRFDVDLPEDLAKLAGHPVHR